MVYLSATGVEGKLQTVKTVKYILALFLYVALGAQAQAAIITVGNHEIAPDTFTDIQILIELEPADTNIIGVALDLQVSQGAVVTGPTIDIIDLTTGTVFETNNDGGATTTGEAPPQQAFGDISTGDLSALPIQNGVLATIRINAAGLTEPATYNLIASAFDPNAGTTLLALIGNDIESVIPTVNDGTLTITPEPTTLAVWVIAGALLTYRTKRSYS